MASLPHAGENPPSAAREMELTDKDWRSQKGHKVVVFCQVTLLWNFQLKHSAEFDKTPRLACGHTPPCKHTWIPQPPCDPSQRIKKRMVSWLSKKHWFGGLVVRWFCGSELWWFAGSVVRRLRWFGVSVVPRSMLGKTRHESVRSEMTSTDKIRQDKTSAHKTRQHKRRQDNTRQDKTRQAKPSQVKSSQGRLRKDKTRLERESTARQDTTIHNKP